MSARGTIHSIQVSDGGVPKTSVTAAEVGPGGLAGDRQEHLQYHGGPERAVCLLGLDVIERLVAEGHPITPGSTGENLTLAGVSWADLAVGRRLLFEDGVELTVTQPAVPCPTIAGSFRSGDFQRMSAESHPGESRLYARVLRGGRLRLGEAFTVLGAGD